MTSNIAFLQVTSMMPMTLPSSGLLSTKLMLMHCNQFNNIISWSDMNGMILNPSKCALLLSRRRQNVFLYDYTILDDLVSITKDHKYLGITIQLDLKWQTHINTICSKATQTLDFNSENF